MKELAEKTKSCMAIERYIVLVCDEMKLIFRKIDLNYVTLQNAQQSATHILVRMVKSVANI